MLEKTLSYKEFCRLAASGEEDPERARKMVSMGILRLKEAVGPELLDTEGDAPQLNMDVVKVDLLDAYRLLTEATRIARHGGLMRALPMVVEGLDIIKGEVPFPTLYDDFFEAMREDFEFHMREAVIEVGQGLLGEGDAASAEEALRRGFNAMPEDEEITELLCKALELQGKRAEAGRVRLQAEEKD
jgi:DNA-binding SARP family transcriptional activator